MDLDELKINAYYDVLKAFMAESSTISSQRIMIMKELKSELKIDHITHTALQEEIKSDTLVQELRYLGLHARKGTSLASSEKVTDAEEQKSTSVEGEAPKPSLIVNNQYVLKLQESFNIAPAKIQQETAEPSEATHAKIQNEKAEASATTTPEELPFPSWGRASPESLVNNIITISIDGEDDLVTFRIKAYDAETEMHQLVTLSSTKEVYDPLDWIDIRYFPREEIIWQKQHPGFTTRNCLLKPGQTILNATTTARVKKPIREVGRSASGIPIIKRLDKGKAKMQ
ncbi:Emsy N Terminus (ENT)/ plant Tudor-like domains-containing protein [Raphanus sativus]|nr:Emsy N Terminus (ENT)/ plant Tudor-like domains-containing protein [Raphanus sativus]